MDKAITIIIAASVLMLAGASVMFMASGNLGEAGNDVDSATNTVQCDIQINCNGEVDLEDLSTECIDHAQETCSIPEEEVDQEIADRAEIPVS